MVLSLLNWNTPSIPQIEVFFLACTLQIPTPEFPTSMGNTVVITKLLEFQKVAR